VLGARDLHTENLWNDYGVVFSGVHKNFGTSGLCFAMVRDDVIDKVISNKKKAKIPIPKIMDWESYAKQSGSNFVNTPSLMAVYITEATCEFFNAQGGLKYYEDLALSKSEAIY
jgi:phosphoserine aminotransferase